MAVRRHRTGPPPKGDRVQINVRFPADHLAHLTEQAQRIGVSRVDYISCKMALAEGLDIPEAVFLWTPRVILLYDADAMPDVIDRLPPAVLERMREQVPEIAELLPPLPDELPLTG